MAWSTKELADLTGVSLRSVRHWHAIGLLPEPERLSNGYKQYTSSHLVLCLRITRLTSLGFSLGQVGKMLHSEESGQESLREMRTELDRRIAELTQIRDDVGMLIEEGISPDLSPEASLAMEALGEDPGSRDVAILLSRLIPKADVPFFVAALAEVSDDVVHLNAEMLELPEDAGEERVAEVAQLGVELIGAFLEGKQGEFPTIDTTKLGEREAQEAMTDLATAHMNSAQRRVLNSIFKQFAVDNQSRRQG